MKKITVAIVWVLNLFYQERVMELAPPKNREERRLRESIMRRQRSLKL